MYKGVSLPALAVLVLLASASFQVLLDDGASAAGEPAPGGGELVVDDVYEAAPYEAWGRVVVTASGSLVVAKGSVLLAGDVVLERGSILEVRGGTLLVEDRGWAGSVGIKGMCDRFVVNRGSLVRVTGSPGAYDLAHSRGGDAVVAVVASYALTIDGSTIELVGGNGMTLPVPMTSGDLGARELSGGDATLDLWLSNRHGKLLVRGSNLTLSGGDGGRAADGAEPPSPGVGGRGGGYTRGGDLDGRVGAGGRATLRLTALSLDVRETLVSTVAGSGGDAGDGASITSDDGTSGGGGGGYSGGDGASSLGRGTPPTPGGSVAGHVGAGGLALVEVKGDEVVVVDTTFELRGGDGGEAGDGGSTRTRGGGGGGGLSGGGGASAGLLPGASGGDVSGNAISGGDALLFINASERLSFLKSGVWALAGDGGAAGMGGDGPGGLGGAGGGGYSGGGGGAGGPFISGGPGTDGGAGGNVTGSVGRGGVAKASIRAPTSQVRRCEVGAAGGNGGDAGAAGLPAPLGDGGGCGGGGHSGGGGGGQSLGTGGNGQGGPSGRIEGQVSDGGDALVAIWSNNTTVDAECELWNSSGEAGYGGDARAPGAMGGEGDAREAQPGMREWFLPVSQPIALSPGSGLEVSTRPVFDWVEVFGHSFVGDLVGYTVHISFDRTTDRPDYNFDAPGSLVAYDGLVLYGIYSWKVIPLYSTGIYGPASDFQWFVFHNAAPEFYTEEPFDAVERQETVLDLKPCISDPDDALADLVIESDHPSVLWVDGLRVSLRFDRPYGLVHVPFTLSDGTNVGEFSIPVRVLDVNDPPQIVSVDASEPPVTLSLWEGTTGTYEVAVLEPEGEKVHFSLFNAWWHVSIDQEGRLVVNAPKGSVGSYSAFVYVGDPRGGSDEARVDIVVLNVPDPPSEPQLLGPANGSIHTAGEGVNFIVRVEDPDVAHGETLEVVWSSSKAGELARLRTTDIAYFTAHDLPVGVHGIEVTVSDGTFETSAWFLIEVVEPPEEGLATAQSHWHLALIATMMAVMAALGYHFGTRGVLLED